MNTSQAYRGSGEFEQGSPNIPLLAEIAKLVLVCGLYPREVNNVLTNAHAKVFAEKFIRKANHAEDAFSEFCQRIMLTRYWRNKHNGYDMPECIRDWLNPKNPKGFAGTALWYERLQKTRKKNPLHLHELKAFAESVLDLAEDPSPNNFSYWASWFIEKQAPDAYLLMQAVGARLAFRELPTYRRLE